MPTTDHEKRRQAIREILSGAGSPASPTGPLTQDALVKALKSSGFKATQSSVSRDLRELGAVKTNDGYRLPDIDSDAAAQVGAVGNLIKGTDTAGPNLLVIKTAIGAAQRVALALDRSNWPEVVGNIGGDDTVFVATRSATAQKNLISKIEHQLP